MSPKMISILVLVVLLVNQASTPVDGALIGFGLAGSFCTIALSLCMAASAGIATPACIAAWTQCMVTAGTAGAAAPF